MMDRLVLSDAAWERIAPLIIGRPDQKGSTGRDNRMFVEGVLWIVQPSLSFRRPRAAASVLQDLRADLWAHLNTGNVINE